MSNAQMEAELLDRVKAEFDRVANADPTNEHRNNITALVAWHNVMWTVYKEFEGIYKAQMIEQMKFLIEIHEKENPPKQQ